ncbi:MAG: hypothetical protein IJ719_14250 [Clostridia bacterium]|nr:hypothetical protein [Clostridia bacterium]
MIDNTSDRGIAFICEGDTEKQFYLSLLYYFTDKHNATIQKILNQQETDIVYELAKKDIKYIIKFKVAESVTGMPKTSKWFDVDCVKKYGSKLSWTAFLCYDIDSYTRDITQFYEGDWKDLRDKLKHAQSVIDLAAKADIEDIMLVDLEGVCAFIDHPPIKRENLLGRKGTAKMKMFFRDCGKSYHKGDRARPLIDSLDKQKIIDSKILDFEKVEDLFCSF